ncbi:hypothetical protein D3C71_1140760 [compost metagenome]
MAPCLADGLDDGHIGGRAIHQPVHVCGGAWRQPGGGLANPGQLGAAVVGRAQGFVGAHALAGAATAQALAHDFLWPEQVKHEQADVGQRRQRQDPTERGYRFALLQHDVTGQHQQIGDIGSGQDLGQMGDVGEGGPEDVQGFAHPPILAMAGDDACGG